MVKLSPEIIRFISAQGFGIISTLDENGFIHCSAKGIAGIDKEGEIYIIDLYFNSTFKNLTANPVVSLTFVDEQHFHGYTLKGRGEIVAREKITGKIIAAWEKKVVERVSRRLIKNIRLEKKSGGHHPEAKLPQPKYMIVVKVEEIVDLSPSHPEIKKL